MAGEPTCGQGIAEHAAIPELMAALTAAVADNLEAHMAALDPEDEHARREHEVYRRLAAAHREVAARLRALGEDMAGSRDLPMGRHDPAAMSAPAVAAAYERFVAAERDLRTLLQGRLERDEAMLGQMRG